MMQWSTEQVAIFKAFSNPDSGHVLVRARAGTGKTTTVVEALSRVPKGTRSLLTAFNKKNADELGQRLAASGVRDAEARTLHSLGFSLVRDQVRAKVDGREGYNVARSVVGRSPRWVPGKVKDIASKAKNCLLPGELSQDALIEVALQFNLLPTKDQERAGWTLERLASLSLDALRAAIAKGDGPFVTIDFDDMVWLPLVWGLESRAYDLVVVDEAQDMSPTQLALAQGACKEGGRIVVVDEDEDMSPTQPALAQGACKEGGRIVVVGDDRQAIYGFRGADSGALDRMGISLGATEYALTTTYRCPRLVVDLAREIVPDYQAAEKAPSGRVERLPAETLTLDPDRVVEPGCYVLGRTNASVVRACLGLLRKGKSAEVAGRDIARQVLSLVETVARGTRSLSVALTRLSRWEEEERSRLLAKAREKDLDLEPLLEALSDRVETIEALSDGLTSVAELEARVESLFGAGSNRHRIVCSTVHRAKGMERDLVVVLEDTLRTGRREEDNIRYVALTRTKRRLVLLSEGYGDPLLPRTEQ